MKRKLQVILSDEAWAAIETSLKDCNDGFINGSINYSDIINEIVLNSKIDIKLLQAKHTNIRKSLRLMASQKEIDIESAIKALMDLKSKTTRKMQKPSNLSFEGAE